MRRKKVQVLKIQDIYTLKKFYNNFDPTHPLQAGDPNYIDCQAVRGDSNILQQGIGKTIEFSDSVTCQLYTGHRGVGKSTELLRLKQYLEENGYLVVYFDAAVEIDPEDARYTDILLACTRHLLDALNGEDNAIMQWLEDRLLSLKELATMSIAVGDSAIGFFAQLMSSLRAVPDMRHQIRQQVDPHTVSLIDALNEFIQDAQKDLSGNKLVLIADSLDRIVPIVTDPESKRTNHDEIFIDRSEQLNALQCHLIYTVPISMAYSGSLNHLHDRYGFVDTLPMITVREKESRKPYLPGIEVFKQLIVRRMQAITPDLSGDHIFEDANTLTELCIMSGGNIRNLILLMRMIMERTPQLPIPIRVVRRAISEVRETYRRMIFEHQWNLLAEVYLSQDMPNEPQYRKLLFDRCILEYRQVDDDQNIITWHDVHPLIEGLDKFHRTLKKRLSK